MSHLTKEQATEVFKYREGLLASLDDIMKFSKNLSKDKIKNKGQLSLFDEEEVIQKPKIKEYHGDVDLIKWANIEKELLGLPVLYEPLRDFIAYKDKYCNKEVAELNGLTEQEDNIIVMDRITDIEYRDSRNGNKYVKIFISQLGSENYLYLWGKNFKEYIAGVFKDEIYLFQLMFNPGTIEFSKAHFVIKHIKNIKDVKL